MARQSNSSSFMRTRVWALLAGLSAISATAYAVDGTSTGTRQVPSAQETSDKTAQDASSTTASGGSATRSGSSDVGRTDVNGVRTRSADAKPEDAVAKKVRGKFSERFSGMPITAVTRTPYGFFEVQIGADLIYTDEEVRWVMQGPLVDATTREDLSAKRLEAASAIEFDTLPLDLALKSVKGDGSRRIATFEDPNCGYCKQLAKTLQSVDNITVYTFVLPILEADSTEKSRNIMCANDPVQAWDDWMLRNKAPAKASAECNPPLASVVALSRKLMVQGTPAIYFEDGTRASGALPSDALNARLDRQ